MILQYPSQFVFCPFVCALSLLNQHSGWKNRRLKCGFLSELFAQQGQLCPWVCRGAALARKCNDCRNVSEIKIWSQWWNNSVFSAKNCLVKQLESNGLAIFVLLQWHVWRHQPRGHSWLKVPDGSCLQQWSLISTKLGVGSWQCTDCCEGSPPIHIPHYVCGVFCLEQGARSWL